MRSFPLTWIKESKCLICGCFLGFVFGITLSSKWKQHDLSNPTVLGFWSPSPRSIYGYAPTLVLERDGMYSKFVNADHKNDVQEVVLSMSPWYPKGLVNISNNKIKKTVSPWYQKGPVISSGNKDKQRNFVDTNVSTIGAWAIPENLLDFINEEWAVLSVGAANEMSFDIGICGISDASVYIVDPTPMSAIHWSIIHPVLSKQKAKISPKDLYKQRRHEQKKDYYSNVEKSSINSSKLRFIPEGLSVNNQTNQKFYKMIKKDSDSDTYYTLAPNLYTDSYIEVPVRRLSDFAMIYGRSGAFEIVKLDIEGFEIEVLKQVVQEGRMKPLIILVDHDGARLGRFKETLSVMRDLREYGYIICRQRNWDAMYIRSDFSSLMGCEYECHLGCELDKEGRLNPFGPQPGDSIRNWLRVKNGLSQKKFDEQ